MNWLRATTPSPWVGFALAASLATLAACGETQDPSFKEDKQTVKLRLTAEPDATGGSAAESSAAGAGGQEFAPPPGMDEAAVFDSVEDDGVWNRYAGAESGTGDAGDSGSDSAGATAGAPSSGDAVAARPSRSGPEGDESLHDDDEAEDDDDGSDGREDGDERLADNPGTKVDQPTFEDTGNIDAAEMRACAALTGAKPSRIKVAGNGESLRAGADTVLAFKLTGNRTHLDLDLEGAEGMSVTGVCLFLAGNQTTATVNVGLKVGSLVYIGRGNRSATEVVVGTGAAIGRLAADLAGNQASLRLGGKGEYPCEFARTRGHDSSFVCQ